MSPPSQRLTELSDEELMLLYLRDEETAFEVLFSRYRRPLFGYLLRLLGQREKAEDVFQEVFFEVIRNRRRFNPKARFAAWVFRIAHNRAVDRLRRNHFREMESLDQPLDAGQPEGSSRLELVPGKDPGPEELARAREVQAALEAALEGLAPEQREVFWLKEKSGLTLAEIAEMTGVSINTVKSRLRYALEKLRQTLSEQGFVP